MFLVEPVFFPLELLERSRNSLDLGLAFDERDGFFTEEEEEGARCPVFSAFRVPRSAFFVPRSSFLISLSSFLTSCLLPLFIEASSVDDDFEMAAMISFISFPSS